MLLGVDVGGTFTDAVLAADGRLITGKAPTTPDDQSQGVLRAVALVLERAGAGTDDVTTFAHGMTVATNALLEGRGARTALVATDGFADVIELRRQARRDLYRLCAAHPEPLVPPERRFGAPERMLPDGPVDALDERASERMLDALAATEPEAVAVVLLHAHLHPDHERRLGVMLDRRLPDVHVSLSHAAAGTFREFERASTTVVDAALSPLLADYLARLAARAGDDGLPTPAIMQSSGGLADIDLAARHAARTVLSGPAGGAAGAAYVARRAGVPHALCFDMGGTSCDVCVVDDGAARESGEHEIAGHPLTLPAIDIHTVGAGGGSIAWKDAGGALRVGPRSAGARPGPACYGQGGERPTVTDANLLLGYLDPEGALPGDIALDRAAAERAVGGLADALALDRLACAAGIVRVANQEMLRALRVMTVERGVDPRGYAIVAFGGAGPMHAAAIASELEIDRVVCPRGSGVLAALGLVVSERRRDAQRSVLLAGEELTADAIAADVAALARDARDALRAPDAALRATFALRYRGQAFELAITAGERSSPAELRSAFEDAHRERYGYIQEDEQVELVTIRVSAYEPGPEPDLAARRDAGEEVRRSEREAIFDGEARTTTVWHGEPAPGDGPDGPAIVALAESTLVVPPGWSARADETGTIHMRR